MNMAEHHFVVCTANDGYEASLELRKLYEVIPDPDAEKHGQVRVVDESGEDYLYPNSFFAPVDLPEQTVAQIVQNAD